ncbi:MAG: LCP family protein [Lachnospiraceae bacterium]|nr:LCP family protein [Lachnospiraceae bacterium]
MTDERIIEVNTGKPKKLRKVPYYIVVAGAFLLTVCCVLISFRLYQNYGKTRLENYALNEPDISAFKEALASGDNSILKGDQISYKGQVYEYNDQLLTFLIMGIDSKTGIGEAKTPGEAGQADMLILGIIDQEEKVVKLINISRDTMVNLKIFDTNGFYLGEEYGQIALQYAYGDGLDVSGRLMEEVVSNLFYGIPIHGYAALEMTAITMMNDAVDGVEVVVIEDMSFMFPNLVLGNTVTLLGDEALVYVQYRDTDVHFSNELRVARQKQYLTGYFGRVKEKTKENITFPFQLYRKTAGYLSSSITADQIAYLSTAVLGCSLADENIFSVQGISEMTDTYDEFHVSDEDLYDLIINVFYRNV